MDKQERMNTLLDLIDEEYLTKEFYIRYFEEIYKDERKKSLTRTAMEAFDTLSEAFDVILNDENYKVIYHRCKELKEILENVILEYFEEREDHALNEVFTPAEIKEINEDKEFFSAFDEYKQDIFKDLFHKEPKKIYDVAKKYLLDDEKHMSLSEEDIIMEMVKVFDDEYVIGQLAEKFTHIIDNHTKYILEVDEENDEDLTGQADSILMPIGQFDINDYFDIYPFLYEYTGERISLLGDEEGNGEISYWGTYEEYFQNILRDMILGNLGRVFEELNNNRHSDYTILMDRLRIETKDYLNVQKILKESQVLYYELNEFEEGIWTKFAESSAEDLYRKGKKGS
ncbi:hypothetical protein [Vallitalea okinawensis]|uniref:hypothetical protein n=1 Tax=Vallitalea okinawensis TaxID=2078660 RepID=UPI000CFADB2F|nr:hypothetical protein [Vallitalea okinawensis]